VPKRSAKQDLTKWLKAQKTLVVPAQVKARPAIDKSGSIRNTEIKFVNPDVGSIDTTGVDHEATPVVDVVNELGVTAMHVEVVAYVLEKSKVFIENLSLNTLDRTHW
jgi:hypothetical protein